MDGVDGVDGGERSASLRSRHTSQRCLQDLLRAKDRLPEQMAEMADAWQKMLPLIVSYKVVNQIRSRIKGKIR